MSQPCPKCASVGEGEWNDRTIVYIPSHPVVVNLEGDESKSGMVGDSLFIRCGTCQYTWFVDAKDRDE